MIITVVKHIRMMMTTHRNALRLRQVGNQHLGESLAIPHLLRLRLYNHTIVMMTVMIMMIMMTTMIIMKVGDDNDRVMTMALAMIFANLKR